MLNPPAHTRLRRLVSAAFTARRVEALRPAVQLITAEACEQVAGETDFISSFALPLPVTVIGNCSASRRPTSPCSRI
jgi:cytochrome P450